MGRIQELKERLYFFFCWNASEFKCSEDSRHSSFQVWSEQTHEAFSHFDVIFVFSRNNIFFSFPQIKSPDLLHDLMTQDSQRQKCTNCVYIMNKVRNNLAETPESSFIKKLLSKCRDMGSFSDSCSTLVVTHAPSFYHYLQDKLNEEDACFLGGLCVGVKPNPLVSSCRLVYWKSCEKSILDYTELLYV